MCNGRQFNRGSFLAHALSLALLPLAGCGGGAGPEDTDEPSTGGNADVDPNAAPLTEYLRDYADGLEWRYTGDYTVTQADGQTRSGAAGFTLVARAMTYDAVLPPISAFRIAPADPSSVPPGDPRAVCPNVVVRQERRPPVKSLHLLAVGETPLRFERLFVPGRWLQGGASELHNYIPGEQFSFTTRVLRSEPVTVPAGRYNTWVARETEKVEGYESEGTFWWTPQLGRYVKADVTVRLGDGATGRYRVELVSTNADAGSGR